MTNCVYGGHVDLSTSKANTEADAYVSEANCLGGIEVVGHCEANGGAVKETIYGNDIHTAGYTSHADCGGIYHGLGYVGSVSYRYWDVNKWVYSN